MDSSDYFDYSSDPDDEYILDVRLRKVKHAYRMAMSELKLTYFLEKDSKYLLSTTEDIINWSYELSIIINDNYILFDTNNSHPNFINALLFMPKSLWIVKDNMQTYSKPLLDILCNIRHEIFLNKSEYVTLLTSIEEAAARNFNYEDQLSFKFIILLTYILFFLNYDNALQLYYQTLYYFIRKLVDSSTPMDFDVFTFKDEIENNLSINTSIEQVFYNIDSFLFDLISLYNTSLEFQQNEETQTQTTDNSLNITNDNNNKHSTTENLNDNFQNIQTTQNISNDDTNEVNNIVTPNISYSYEDFQNNSNTFNVCDSDTDNENSTHSDQVTSQISTQFLTSETDNDNQINSINSEQINTQLVTQDYIQNDIQNIQNIQSTNANNGLNNVRPYHPNITSKIIDTNNIQRTVEDINSNGVLIDINVNNNNEFIISNAISEPEDNQLNDNELCMLKNNKDVNINSSQDGANLNNFKSSSINHNINLTQSVQIATNLVPQHIDSNISLHNNKIENYNQIINNDDNSFIHKYNRINNNDLNSVNNDENIIPNNNINSNDKIRSFNNSHNNIINSNMNNYTNIQDNNLITNNINNENNIITNNLNDDNNNNNNINNNQVSNNYSNNDYEDILNNNNNNNNTNDFNDSNNSNNDDDRDDDDDNNNNNNDENNEFSHFDANIIYNEAYDKLKDVNTIDDLNSLISLIWTNDNLKTEVSPEDNFLIGFIKSQTFPSRGKFTCPFAPCQFNGITASNRKKHFQEIHNCNSMDDFHDSEVMLIINHIFNCFIKWKLDNMEVHPSFCLIDKCDFVCESRKSFAAHLDSHANLYPYISNFGHIWGSLIYNVKNNLDIPSFDKFIQNRNVYLCIMKDSFRTTKQGISNHFSSTHKELRNQNIEKRADLLNLKYSYHDSQTDNDTDSSISNTPNSNINTSNDNSSDEHTNDNPVIYEENNSSTLNINVQPRMDNQIDILENFYDVNTNDLNNDNFNGGIYNQNNDNEDVININHDDNNFDNDNDSNNRNRHPFDVLNIDDFDSEDNFKLEKLRKLTRVPQKAIHWFNKYKHLEESCEISLPKIIGSRKSKISKNLSLLYKDRILPILITYFPTDQSDIDWMIFEGAIYKINSIFRKHIMKNLSLRNDKIRNVLSNNNSQNNSNDNNINTNSNHNNNNINNSNNDNNRNNNNNKNNNKYRNNRNIISKSIYRNNNILRNTEDATNLIKHIKNLCFYYDINEKNDTIYNYIAKIEDKIISIIQNCDDKIVENTFKVKDASSLRNILKQPIDWRDSFIKWLDNYIIMNISNKYTNETKKKTETIKNLYDEDPGKALDYYVWNTPSPPCQLKNEDITEHFINNWSTTPDFDIRNDEESYYNKWKLNRKIDKESNEYFWNCIFNIKYIKEVILKRRNSSAHGIDAISNALFTCAVNESAKMFQIILFAIKTTEKFPSNWRLVKTILLYKKGNDKDVKNWRPICLTDTSYRIIMSIFTKGLQLLNSICPFISNVQRGFIHNVNGCMINAINSNEVINHSLRIGKDFYACTIDFRDAFGSIPHKLIFQNMYDLGINETFIKIIKNAYKNLEAVFVTPNGKTDNITINKGVRQGCPLSPLLFNIAIEPLICDINKNFIDYGIHTSNNSYNIPIQAYADDILLMSSSDLGLQEMLDELSRFCNYSKLSIAYEKCAISTYIKRNGRRVNSDTIFTINENEINYVTLEKTKEYLGIPVAKDRITKFKNNEEVTDKIKHKLNLLMNSKLRLNQKIDAIRRFIIPSLDYLITLSTFKRNTLNEINLLIRKTINKHVNALATPIPVFHTSWTSGGLSIPDLREKADVLAIKNLYELLNNEDDNIKTMYLSWLEEEKIFRKAETVNNNKIFFDWKIRNNKLVCSRSGTDGVFSKALKAVLNLSCALFFNADGNFICSLSNEFPNPTTSTSTLTSTPSSQNSNNINNETNSFNINDNTQEDFNDTNTDYDNSFNINNSINLNNSFELNDNANDSINNDSDSNSIDNDDLNNDNNLSNPLHDPLNFNVINNRNEIKDLLKKHINNKWFNLLIRLKLHGHTFLTLKKNKEANFFFSPFTPKINDNILKFTFNARCNNLCTGEILAHNKSVPKCNICNKNENDSLKHRLNSCITKKEQFKQRHDLIVNSLTRYIESSTNQKLSFHLSSTIVLNNTDRLSDENAILKPDIWYEDHVKNSLNIIEVTCSYGEFKDDGHGIYRSSLDIAYEHKMRKYNNLCEEIRNKYNKIVNYFVIVISSLGAIQDNTKRNIYSLLNNNKKLAKRCLRYLSLCAVRGSALIFWKIRFTARNIIETNNNDNSNEENENISDILDNLNEVDNQDLSITQSLDTQNDLSTDENTNTQNMNFYSHESGNDSDNPQTSL